MSLSDCFSAAGLERDVRRERKADIFEFTQQKKIRNAAIVKTACGEGHDINDECMRWAGAPLCFFW
jgi:hypothetical protein